MNKYKLVYYFSLALIPCWALSVYELVEDHGDFMLWLSVMMPIVFVLALHFLSRDLIPISKLKDIFKLALEIEKRVEKSSEPIIEKNAPIEIKPLINAVNKLIDYQEDRYKNERDFTANASHELRTPLAGIRLQTEIAMRTEDKEKRDKALKNILRSVDRATRLAEQLLILSRLTAEKIDLAKEPVELKEIAEKVTEELTLVANEKDIIIEAGKLDNGRVLASEQSIEILIDNLIRNSIIYIHKGGKIKYETIKYEEKIVLSITDNGPGIPREKRKIIFERFEKADKGSKTGTGLGLSIVKRIADLHNAKIEIADTEDSTGLRINVYFNAIETNSN